VATTYQRTEKKLLATELSASELVMLDVDSAHYYGCEGVAKTIWDELEQPRTLAQLVDVVQARYPDAPPTVAEEITSFIDELRAEALLIESTGT